MGRSLGTNVIINDDSFPELTISDTSVVEGNSGTVNALFTIGVFPPSSQTITVRYYTADNTATAPSDYVAIPDAVLTISPGETNAIIAVAVKGDTINEIDEFFFVFLYGEVNAVISKGGGVCMIVNDDYLPTIVPAGSNLLAEACSDGAIDPNETVTVEFGLGNVSLGLARTTNLTATLLAATGVTAPSGPRNYGALAPGVTSFQPFTFTAKGTCGGLIAAKLQLQDGSNDLGTVRYVFQLGRRAVAFSENFDNVAVPGLPVGWSATSIGAGSPWRTSTNASDTGPNAVNLFTGDLPLPAILVVGSEGEGLTPIVKKACDVVRR